MTADLKRITALRLFEGHTGVVCGVAISPDGKRAVSCSGCPLGDCTMRLWDMASGKEIRRLQADRLAVLPSHTKLVDPPGEIAAIAFAPDGRHVLFGGANGVLGLLERRHGNRRPPFRRTQKHGGRGCRLAGWKAERLSGGRDGTVRLWDMATGELPAHDGPYGYSCAAAWRFRRRDRALSGSLDHTMRLWDLKKGEQIREPFLGHPTFLVRSVAFLPDGRQAISCDKTIRLWDLSRDISIGGQLRTFDGHTLLVTDVAISPDGRRVLSGSCDQTVRLWDRITGREIALLVGHRNWVLSVAFTPDGATLSAAEAE